ncbi:MAG: hypothetical protein WA354_18125 [Terracidiphilus sp.]
MRTIVDFPSLLFASSFAVLGVSAYVGAFRQKKLRPFDADDRQDFGIVQGTALSLLGLLIGFTFSMAMSRYEQRRIYEEAEANAIGTEYARAGLLPAADTKIVRDQLISYLDRRVLFYTTRDAKRLLQIDTDTAQLQNELWSAVQARAVAQPTILTSLVVGGMNDVLNSEGYTQAAWWNRIPIEAWVLLAVIAIGCNLLIGHGTHRTSPLLIVLPLAVSLSFFLIADIDSPRGGMIRMRPENLLRLSQSLHAHPLGNSPVDPGAISTVTFP